MKNLCVFCGSKKGVLPGFSDLAIDLGLGLAKNSIGLVYGGGSVGLMGLMANSVLDNGGKVFGVIPKKLLDWEVGHDDLTELHVVDDMHQRKRKMYDLSHGFVALPGGFGTMDELCEIITWAQLEYHRKPIWIFNQKGYYDHLIAHFDHMVKCGFVRPAHRSLVIEVKTLEELIEAFVAQA